MDISFIINSYGRPYSEIKNSLKSCRNQAETRFTFEVIFVDQNKSPLIPEDKSIIHIQTLTTSISKARNLGALHAQGEWLIFVDDDAIVDPSYLSNFQKQYEKIPSAAVWAGSIYLIDDRQTFYSRRQNISNTELSFFEMKVLMGGNIIIRRDLFAAIGKFDEDFGIGGKYPSSEDTDLAWRLYYAGFPIRLSHEIRVYHPAPKAISMKKAYRYGLGKGALVGKWLFKQHKFQTTIELTEMIIVPFFKMIIDAKAMQVHFATLAGRIKGLIRYAF